FARDEYTLPVLGARLIAPEIGTERIVAFAMPELVVLAAESRAGDARAIGTAAELAKWTDGDAFGRAVTKVRTDLGLTDDTLLDAFEASVAKIGAGASGGIFDGTVEKAYCRAAMGTALYRGGIHALDRWHAPSAWNELLARFAKGGGGLGDDFRAWYGALVHAREPGKRAGGTLWATAGVLPNLG